MTEEDKETSANASSVSALAIVGIIVLILIVALFLFRSGNTQNAPQENATVNLQTPQAPAGNTGNGNAPAVPSATPPSSTP